MNTTQTPRPFAYLSDEALAAEIERAAAHQRVVVRGSSGKAIDTAIATLKALSLEAHIRKTQGA